MQIYGTLKEIDFKIYHSEKLKTLIQEYETSLTQKNKADSKNVVEKTTTPKKTTRKKKV